ncbi:MAG: PQQ-dependent sugar dehydrogenase [Fimbriimonadales bacterium]
MKSRCSILLLTVLVRAVSPAQNLFLEDLFFEVVGSELLLPTAIEFVDQNTILVTQKEDGKVVVLDGSAVPPVALDLTVATEGEMGILGIVRHPDFDRNKLIYLYHCRADKDGGAWIEDRLETYRWDSGTKTLVLDSTIAIWGAEGWPTSQYHHGGYLKIGPDRKLYVQHGDMMRFGVMEVNDPTGISGSNAAIYRLELDGSVPVDNPFASSPIKNFQRAHTYGMRNGFGMAFDPLSDQLWYTENGPEIYDELNIAEPGMNSGWHLIMGPDSRDADMQVNGGITYDEKDLFMLPGAHYADPVLSFLDTIGLTAIEFLWKTKFPDALRDKAILCSTGTGRLFLLPVAKDRKGLDLPRLLADKVVDSVEERDLLVIGTGWGVTTDARVGPDGYLYVCSWQLGKVYRIRPKMETVDPTLLEVVRGVSSGSLPELIESDDQYFTIQPGRVLFLSQTPALVRLETTSPFSSISALSFSIEAACDSGSNVPMGVRMFNWSTGQYDLVATQNMPNTDQVFVSTFAKEGMDYVNPKDRKMLVEVSFGADGSSLLFPWTARIDDVSWTLTKQVPR